MPHQEGVLMNPFKVVFLIVLVTAMLTACTPGREREQLGGLIGAGLGALAGSQIGSGRGQLAAVAIGTLGGAWAGSEIGRRLDERDRLLASQAIQQSFHSPVGDTIRWNNPETGHYGTVRSTRDGTDMASGAYCREYQQVITVGGRQEMAYGSACQMPDGDWRIVQEPLRSY
jgi:surface antigen